MYFELYISLEMNVSLVIIAAIVVLILMLVWQSCKGEDFWAKGRRYRLGGPWWWRRRVWWRPGMSPAACTSACNNDRRFKCWQGCMKGPLEN